MKNTPLNDEIRKQLRSLHEASGVGPQRLLNGKVDRPRGLNSTRIYHWMDGTAKTAWTEHLNWVLANWQAEEPLEPFTQADNERLDRELKRTGYTQTTLLNRLSPVPEGLTPDILHRLKSRRLHKLPSAHKKFLFKGLSALPDR
ncbi:hypothetical protein [Henriciella algicola]|uniref:Uncharacterized protein n=1 Tax=Henriciella algicola TaxID=1608422 RepID=A0A399RN00_9PROT|nr:hypothetical protein [Henriciella algicola]RIJ31055.1 hypothetical protein D1222_01950 [Henriciella algicola]